MPIDFTEAAVRRLRPTSKRRIIRDGRSRSLFLIISTSGHKSWAMRFRRPDGGSSKIVLGPYDQSGHATDGEPKVGEPLSLARARQLAAKIVADRAHGRDVISDHKAARHRKRVAVAESAANTYPAAVHSFVLEHAKPKTRNWQETSRLLGLDPEDLSIRSRSLAERWRDRDVRTLDAGDLHAAIAEARKFSIPGIVARHDKPLESRARKTHAALSQLYTWLLRHRRITTNPMRDLFAPPAPKARDRVLTVAEVRAFWAATDELKAAAGDALKLLLITGARLNEIVRMPWSEVSEDGVTITVSGSRTRNGRPLVVQLPALGRAIIASRPRDGATHVFAANSITAISIGSKIKNRIDKLMGHPPEWRLHDLRRTAVTMMGELGIRPDVIELVVNHVSGSRGGIAGTYNRSELMAERREALEKWAAHLLSIVSNGGGR
jgi:integrase